MLSNADTAKRISELMLDVGARLDASVALVQSTYDDTEFLRYRRFVGGFMGATLIEIMNPLCATHPHLKPDGLK